MIGPRELRIGNFVNGYIKTTMLIVEEIGTGYLVTNGTRKRSVDVWPIPLTPEWLERFGFTEFKAVEGDKSSFDMGKFTVSYISNVTYFNSWKILDAPPRYVHQLQNLYFALTGNELTLKDKP